MFVLDKEAFDIFVNSLKGIPSRKPVYIEAGHLRAILRNVNRDGLPEDPDSDSASQIKVKPGDSPPEEEVIQEHPSVGDIISEKGGDS